GRGPGTLEVAMADPAALAPLDDLRLLYGLRIEPVVVPANALREAIARAYDAAAAAAAEDGSTLGARLELDATPLDDTEPPDLLEAGDGAPPIRPGNPGRDGAGRAHGRAGDGGGVGGGRRHRGRRPRGALRGQRGGPPAPRRRPARPPRPAAQPPRRARVAGEDHGRARHRRAPAAARRTHRAAG